MTKDKKTCPCSSGDPYSECCQLFHKGKIPENALQLMRSRYSAYSLNLPDYIIQTTHPGSPEYTEDYAGWRKKISAFSLNSKFNQLEVLDFHENGPVASVTFVAHITQGKQDMTFTEKSMFEKIRGKWLYRAGQLMEGKAPNLMTVGQMRVLPLAYYGAPVLRKVAEPVVEITDAVRKLAEEMIETMDACDGIGIAAPQVHHSTRMFVIREPIEDAEGNLNLGEATVYINPTLSHPSVATWKASEGCLSIPTIHAEVERPKEITIEYTDLDGKKVSKHCIGWLAKAVMHENDHLNGVLFIDHLPKEQREAIEPMLKRLHKRIHDGTEL